MIIIEHLTKVYETVNYNIIALQDINYKLDKGEVVVLLGKSGSGKSTLLNILGGFDKEYAGHYILDGEDMKSKSEREIDVIRKRKIGFVFQHYVLLNNLTVLENVELSLKSIGVVHDRSRKRAALHALKLVGLRDHANKYPYELSGGQKQRVAIARAFVKNPDVIIADEPTAALDSRTSKEILDLLKDLCRTKLLIIATHNKSIVRDYASRVIELRSGYTVRDELITDRSKVHVDELDLIIDQELKEEETVINQLIEAETSTSIEHKESVLKDLGINLEEFRLNRGNQFSIDEELKKRMIKERMKSSRLQTRIYRFLQTSDDFYGKREYANKSFFRNIGFHLFSAFIFVVFLLTLTFGFQFVTETFGGFNEKALYTREMNNANTLYYTSSSLAMDLQDKDLYDVLGNRFINDFSQNEIDRNRFIDILMEDPYFQYKVEQERIQFIAQSLSSSGHDDAFDIYYNNSVVVMRKLDDDIVLAPLQDVYQSILEFPQPFVKVTSFLDADLEDGSVYPFDLLFVESNKDLLAKHLIEGGKLPTEKDEVAIPVSTLFQYEILHTSDFKDEYGNIMEVIPSEMIQEAFDQLPNSQKTVRISKDILTFSDFGSSYTMDVQEETNEFKVVGLLNFEGDIQPFLDWRDDVFVLNSSDERFSFVFSQKASEYLTFDIIDQAEYADFTKHIELASISKEDYTLYNVEDIEKQFETEYIGQARDEIVAKFSTWINVLRDAAEDVVSYVQDDLNGLSPDSSVLFELVDSELFPGLTKGDILNYYVARHMLVINDETEFNYLCPGCDLENRTIEYLLTKAPSAYVRLKVSSEYKDVLEHFGEFSRLTYQEATNTIIYQEYGNRFNHELKKSYNSDVYKLVIPSPLEKESGSILSLVYVVVPRIFVETLPFMDSFVRVLTRLETNESFAHFMQSTNLDLLISSFSTNTIRSVVLMTLFLIVYLILFISIILLSVVLINLYGNVYETATRRRIRELASLRILGSSSKDIQDMVRLENRRVALFSYGMFVIILFLLSRLDVSFVSSSKHFFMPMLGLFFDFDVLEILTFNKTVLLIVTVVFYFFIYRFVINRVSTKHIQNIDTIRAIRDGDNL
jgi:ABC-type lipoprotein export system ATPase subunit